MDSTLENCHGRLKGHGHPRRIHDVYTNRLKNIISNKGSESKEGCVFLMVVVSILPPVGFGPNDHREDAPHFTNLTLLLVSQIQKIKNFEPKMLNSKIIRLEKVEPRKFSSLAFAMDFFLIKYYRW